MGMAAILVMWPGLFEPTFVPASYGVSIWNLSLIGPVVSEKMFENVGGRTTDGRRSDWYTISSPMSFQLRWANKEDQVALNCSPEFYCFLYIGVHLKLATEPGDMIFDIKLSHNNHFCQMILNSDQQFQRRLFKFLSPNEPWTLAAINIARSEQSSHTPGGSHHRLLNTFREKTKLLKIS